MSEQPDTTTGQPLRREDLEEAAEAMQKFTGGRVTLQWRTRAHGRFVAAGATQQSEATIYGMEDNKLHILLDEDDAPDDPELTLTPFPNPDVEYFTVQIRPGSKPKPLKRPRMVEPRPPTEAFAAAAQCIIDAKAQKQTVAVDNGDGLRIPQSIPSHLEAAYPPLWFLKRSKTNDAEASNLRTSWISAWVALAQYMGAVFKSELHRTAFGAAVRNAANSVCVGKPGSKEEWKYVFHSVFAALSEIVTVTHGPAAASKVVKRLNSGLDSNLLDIEEALRLAEEPEEPPGTKYRTAPDSLNLQLILQKTAAQEEQIAALKTKLREIEDPPHHNSSFRGQGPRGRGRGRPQH